jgi:hypothetical protein
VIGSATFNDVHKYDVWLLKLAADNTVGITNNYQGVINNYVLLQNFPNPFNPSTNIPFDLPQAEHVKLEIFTIAGQKVETLLNKKMKAGNHEVEFNAQNLSSGIYFYRIEAGEFQDVKKMILIR